MSVLDTAHKTARVVLAPRKARPFHGRHPWVLDAAIERVEGEASAGDIVELFSNEGKWIARGLYNPHSRIRVRLYTWRLDETLTDEPPATEPLAGETPTGECPANEPASTGPPSTGPLPSELLADTSQEAAFWRRRLKAALAAREALFAPAADQALRLVYSEADGLSGLVIDRYAGYLVVQVSSLAIAARLKTIVDQVVELAEPRGVLVRGDHGVGALEGLTDLPEGPYWGEAPDGPVFISEHGLRYGVDLLTGQKTGFFLDQRDNRRAAAGYMKGRRVLDMFCYSGGFALCAARLGGAQDVLGVDSSAKAIALAKANAQLNEISNVRFEADDAFRKLQSLAEQRARFGAIVLDPPKFARRRQAVADALRAYHKFNELAVELLEPGGVLVTCSCSGHVTREDLLHVLAEVARRSGREIQVLEQRGAAADHPTSVTCLETDYLKCLICRVS
jgi:23S rRNA (cytosine1962-C5)-methyltransferase